MSRLWDLTKRERQVLALLERGYSTKDIARELDICEVTARNHIQGVLSKLGVHSRLAAVLQGRGPEPRFARRRQRTPLGDARERRNSPKIVQLH